MRRTWALTPFLVAPLLAAPVAATGSSPSTRLVENAAAAAAPNIVMLMVDDMRTDELRFMPRTRRLVGQPGATFRNAIVPDTETTRDFVRLLDDGVYDDLKGKPVVTYCTGGIRCEVLSSLMVSRGFGEVYQLDGGIARYGEEYGDDGLWEGSLYVFDRPLIVTVRSAMPSSEAMLMCSSSS